MVINVERGFIYMGGTDIHYRMGGKVMDTAGAGYGKAVAETVNRVVCGLNVLRVKRLYNYKTDEGGIIRA
ncbi:hypothetical protein K1Y79_02630 [Chitinophaga sp. B61]|uniref:Uncharacterized protein n=1 Tax=Chitinophaga rhizophila TaxID=2866212 RepID=A0ABS7G9M3_9BACT|nr:hypothetical protein [Chitinophaga rhizophila]